MWEWVSDFCDTHRFWVFEKKIRIKENHWFQAFENFQNQKEPLVLGPLRKNQIQRTAGSGYFGNKSDEKNRRIWVFQKLQRIISGFMKELAKTGWF